MKYRTYSEAVKVLKEAVPEMPDPESQLLYYHAYGEAQGLIDDQDCKQIVSLMLRPGLSWAEQFKDYIEELDPSCFEDYIEAAINNFRQSPEMYLHDIEG